MSFVVDTGEVLEIKMRVDLGGRQVRVSQQLLDTAQISTGFKEMRSERVSEDVRVDPQADSLSARPVRNSLLYGPRSQAAAVPSHEQRGLPSVGYGGALG